MKKLVVGGAIVALLSGSAFAHSAIMNCFDNGDGTITCEGGLAMDLVLWV